MRKKISSFLFAVSLCCTIFSQVSYEPISQRDLERMGRLLVQDRMAGLLTNNYVSLGPLDLGPLEHFLSYNPLEGVRLRLSGRTNTGFSKRMAFDWLVAYGTNDKKLKYAASASFNLKRKPKSVYSFPANTITVYYSDNSYMPNLGNYDALYYFLDKNTSYYLAYKREAGIKYLYEFPVGVGISPFAEFNDLYSQMYYSYGESNETLDKPYRYASLGLEAYFKPNRKKTGNTSLNSRLTRLETELSVNLSHNLLLNNSDSYSKVGFIASERLFLGKRMALDMRISGGKIFGNTSHYFYFTPTQSYGLFSSYYGMNLLNGSNYFYRKEYIQLFAQLNFGGLFCDVIPIFKKWRMNEFIYGKALYGECSPYYEVGFGIDNIFSSFGFELIRSFGLDGDMSKGMWGIRIRVK